MQIILSNKLGSNNFLVFLSPYSKLLCCQIPPFKFLIKDQKQEE